MSVQGCLRYQNEMKISALKDFAMLFMKFVIITKAPWSADFLLVIKDSYSTF